MQQTINDAAGVIPEFISIRYGACLMDAVATKEDQLSRGVFSRVVLREARADKRVDHSANYHLQAPGLAGGTRTLSTT